jgi:hypothetical protein
MKLSDASRDPGFARLKDGNHHVMCVVTEIELANLCLKGARHRGFDHGIKKMATTLVTKLGKRWINMRKSLVSSLLSQFIFSQKSPLLNFSPV